MQIIIVSSRLTSAKTLTLSARHWWAIGVGTLLMLLMLATLLSWFSVRWRLPVVEDLILSLQQRETRQSQQYLQNNLQLMATRLGEMQARLMHLDSLGDRLSGVAGVKREVGRDTPAPGRGGPYVPATLDARQLQLEIDKLSVAIEGQADEFAMLESRLLEKRVRERAMPTTLPVREASLGSGFGRRVDPINGTQAIHDGLDFNAEIGAPVVAAAAGVVIASEFRPDYGNVVEIDHGEGLTSLYAHMSKLKVQVGQVVKRGTPVGALGNTGRSTGPHLHFEVRMFGAPQNPAHFLQHDADFAHTKTRQARR